MQLALDAARKKAAATYNAAADHFDAAPLTFWDRIGRRTVELLAPEPGARILDVGCGSGASALPAACTVGPAGHVLGIDLADGLLALARAKAAGLGLDNLVFERGDMAALDLPEECFDAVVCGFAIFFVPDMQRQVQALWRLVKPGGTLAITTWGPRAFEPGGSLFWEGVARIRPDLKVAFNPWHRIARPAALGRLMVEAGTAEPEILAEDSVQPLAEPEDWWQVALGSGFRWTIEQLTADEAFALREDNLTRLRQAGTDAIETNALYARARKPAA